MENIIFTNVNKDSEVDINDLYKILKLRSYNISHSVLPSFEEHKYFVKNNPYRIWSIIRKDNQIIGTFYLTFENVVGVNLINPSEKYYIFIIKEIFRKYLPLKEKKSLISKYFIVNANPSNQKLIKALNSVGMVHIQNTYAQK
mgnify:CR=1 FL=1|tara:strand:+ start:480 stop:908 length:429 start_codon:yes stop_codon:yes gene_type:complete